MCYCTRLYSPTNWETCNAALVFNMKSEILDEYDKAGTPSFNYSQQGINPKNFIRPVR